MSVITTFYQRLLNCIAGAVVLTAVLVVSVVVFAVGCDPVQDPGLSSDPAGSPALSPETAVNPDGQSPAPPAIMLFDGTLDGWEAGVYGNSDEVCLEDDSLILEAGYPMAGIATTHDDLPKDKYELTVESRKLIGSDFFCAITFPVGDSHCTFVPGGWGGATTGLSCIDGMDASSNETKSFRSFEKDQWYQFRIRVTPEKIEVWIDEDQAVDFDREGREISLRNETKSCKPLGIASFETRTAIRVVTVRLLDTTQSPAGGLEPESEQE